MQFNIEYFKNRTVYKLKNMQIHSSGPRGNVAQFLGK